MMENMENGIAASKYPLVRQNQCERSRNLIRSFLIMVLCRNWKKSASQTLNFLIKKKISEEKVLESVNEYSALLQRKKTYNHFSERHQELLNERPWKKCKCKVCKDAGIDIVVFRGANRNRRRGFHNTWVFYHKILNRGHKKSSKK